MSVYEIYDKTVKKNKRKYEMLTMQNIAHLLGKRGNKIRERLTRADRFEANTLKK